MSLACRLGDTGTYGGNVLNGNPKVILEGVPITFDGALFFCPMITDDWVHGVQVIRGTGYKFKVDGRITAQQGDICCPICGNRLIAMSPKLMLG